MVLKYQKHSCIPGRCYKKDTKVKKCKYGLPYDLLGKDGLDSSGIRYNYARFSEEIGQSYRTTRNCLAYGMDTSASKG